MKTTLRFLILLLFIIRALSDSFACDNTPLLVVYDPVEIAGGQWNLEVFVCFGSTESEDGFTLESTDGSINILNSTPSALENPYNGNYADALFSGGVLNYYYDNTDGSNYNDADGETGPCVDFQITVDSDPIGSSFTMAGVNDGCDYTISDDYLTSEVTFTPNCSASQSMVAPGSVSGNTENSPSFCNFRSPVFSTVKEDIIEVLVPCDGQYTFSLCGSSFDTWMAISYQCCFLPFASNDNFCSAQSEITVDLLAGTYYILVEGFLWDDVGNYTLTVTSSTDAVSIDNIDISNPSCSLNDAEITIHASGSDAPYMYSIDGGNTFSSDSTFTGLSAGNYFIVVESQSSCLASTILSVNTNPPLVLDNISGTPASCDSLNGEIIIDVSSGTLPYQYSIDNGVNYQLSNTFSDLEGATYLISVQDDNGCEVNSTYFLDSSSQPSIDTIEFITASCGLATGQIFINASGDADLSYSIDGVNFQSSAVFSGLLGGTYPNITVQDANGCSVDSSFFLSSIPAPIISQVILNPSDCDASGSIEITASGGGGDFQYSIDGGLNYASTSIFSGLLSGDYTIAIIDANLCTVDSIVQLGQNTSLVIDSIHSTDPSCDPSSGTISANGEIEIFASGGLASLEYSIDNGNSFQSGSVFSSLLYGSFQVLVSDGTCTVDTVINLSTNPGPEIDILDARDLSCGEINGFIAVKVLNPTDPDYTYEFDNGTEIISSGAISDDQYSYDQLTDGLWNISVSDGNGCVADTSVELAIIPDISVNSILIDSVFCNQQNGGFTIIASSGNLPIEYSFNSDMSDAQGNGYFNDLSAGSYTVYLRDERFCLDTVVVNLSNADGVQIDSIQSVDPTCLDHNGEITVFASEGTPPYFFSVDNGLSFQTGNYFSGLHDEVYEILVVDASGCVATSSVTLVETNGLSLSVETVPLSCGEQNGEITIIATGGDNNYTFTVDNGIPQSNNSGVFNGLSSGFYDVEVVDGQGCTAFDNVYLDSLPGPQIDTVLISAPNCNASNGSIEIQVSGGNSPYQYSIDDGLSFSSASLFENLSAGIYPVIIVDSLQCQDSIIVNLNTDVQLSITDIILSNPTCGDLSGSAIVLVEDAVPPIQYVLNGVDTNTTGFFENLNEGSFTLLLIDSLGCTKDSSFILVDTSIPNPPALTMAGFNSCIDTLLISANDPQPSTGMWSVITGGASILLPPDSVTIALNLSSGINQFVWTISNGICPSTSDTLTINRIDGIEVDAGEAQNVTAGTPVQLIASTSIPGNYLWSPPEYLNVASIYNPIATVNESTQFFVSITNDYGCFGEDSVWVYIAQELIFGTAFTPNNDGNNDTWIIQNIELYPNAEVSIMSRYGNIVYESIGYTTPWDGTFNGKEVPVGSYFYIINLGDGFETKTGSISVIR